jgi:hypothetical protein
MLRKLTATEETVYDMAIKDRLYQYPSLHFPHVTVKSFLELSGPSEAMINDEVKSRFLLTTANNPYFHR